MKYIETMDMQIEVKDLEPEWCNPWLDCYSTLAFILQEEAFLQSFLAV